MNDFTPIGSGNDRGNIGIRVNLDREHGGMPDHVDMIVPIKTPFYGADKIRVNGIGEIISHEHK